MATFSDRVCPLQFVAFALYATPLFFMTEKLFGVHEKPLYVRLPVRLPVGTLHRTPALSFGEHRTPKDCENSHEGYKLSMLALIFVPNLQNEPWHRSAYVVGLGLWRFEFTDFMRL